MDKESDCAARPFRVRPPESIDDFEIEIVKLPKEYWPNLLQIIRLFRESVTLKPAPSDVWAKLMHDIKNPDPVEKAARQKALSELLRSWDEEGDEQEQKETWEFLRQALDEDRLSNRPLFP